MPLRAAVAAHASAAVAPAPEGATPAVTASAPLIGATAVALAPLGSAPVLRMLTPVVRVVVVVVQWEAGMGPAGPRALESGSLVSSKDLVDKGSARRRSSRGDPLPPERGEPGSRPSRRPTWMGTAHAKPPPLLGKPEHLLKRSICARINNCRDVKIMNIGALPRRCRPFSLTKTIPLKS